MKWTIAVLTTPTRKEDLTRIRGIIDYQIGDKTNDIEVIVAAQHDLTIGEKRQWCLDKARGDYFNFIDDDDIIAHDYVQTIFPLLNGVDYIGFRLQHYQDGKKSKPTFHSLRYSEWSEDGSGYYRNVSHLNPIKTDIARQGTFAGNYAEDYNWSLQVKPVTEHFIDRPMYFYFFSPKYSEALVHGKS